MSTRATQAVEWDWEWPACFVPAADWPAVDLKEAQACFAPAVDFEAEQERPWDWTTREHFRVESQWPPELPWCWKLQERPGQARFPEFLALTQFLALNHCLALNQCFALNQ